MKTNLIKTLCLTLISFLISLNITKADSALGGPIIISNWQNGMSTGPSYNSSCILLGTPPQLSVSLSARCAVPNVEENGPIYLAYQFGDFASGMLLLQNDDLEEIIINNTQAYEIVYMVDIEMETYCRFITEDPTDISVSYGLYTIDSEGDFVVFPAQQYENSLFPQDLFPEIATPGFEPVYSGVKSVCCRPILLVKEEGRISQSRFLKSNPEVPLNERENNSNLKPIQVFPNPFKDQIQIEVEESKAVLIEIRISDLLGREKYFNQFNNYKGGHFSTRIDTQSLPPGLYLLQMKIGDQINLIHLVKS